MVFSPCLPILFADQSLSFTDKMRIVHRLGFTAYEFWNWADLDLDEVVAVQNELGMKAATFLVKSVSLTDPASREVYIEEVRKSIEVAKRLGSKHLLTLTGRENDETMPREQRLESVIEGLQAVVPYLEDAGITAVLEPLNQLVDHPGYFLNTSEEAFQIIDEVSSANVKVLFDIYHQQITEGNLIPTIVDHMDKIGYFHIADHPGRNEPGTGEINYHNVLRAIQNTGYKGYIGLEYRPTIDPEVSLRQFRENYEANLGL